MRFFAPALGLLIFFCAVPRRTGGGEVGFSVVGTGESAGDGGVGLLAGGDCRSSSWSPESSPARARSSSSKSSMLSEATRAVIQAFAAAGNRGSRRFANRRNSESENALSSCSGVAFALAKGNQWTKTPESR